MSKSAYWTSNVVYVPDTVNEVLVAAYVGDSA